MTVLNILAIVFLAIGIAFALVDGAGWRNPIFWILLAFAVLYVIGPAVGQIRG
jgi:hypothetical protein